MARKQPVGRDRFDRKLYGGDPVTVTGESINGPRRQGVIVTMVPDPLDRGRLLRRRSVCVRLLDTDIQVWARGYALQYDYTGWAYIDRGL